MSSPAVAKAKAPLSRASAAALAPSAATSKIKPDTSSPGPATAPSLTPVPVNATAFAQVATHVASALQLSFFLVRFRALVADPVATMWGSLPVLAALQVGYAALCLPVAGSVPGKAPRRPRPGEKKKHGAEASGPNVFVATFLSLLLCLIATPFVYGVMVLFGAPLLTHSPETMLCAAHLALLGLFPAFFARGADGAVWTAMAGGQAPLDEVVGALFGAVVGAWLGAVPIPLDWDRDWQQWPVTILCGLYAGGVLGKVVGGTVAFGKSF